MNIDDKELYTKWMNDKDVSENLGSYFRMISLSSEEKWLEEESNGYNFAIVLKDGDRVIPIDNKSLGGPNVKWEEMAKTSYAKRKIKEFSDKSLK